MGLFSILFGARRPTDEKVLLVLADGFAFLWNGRRLERLQGFWGDAKDACMHEGRLWVAGDQGLATAYSSVGPDELGGVAVALTAHAGKLVCAVVDPPKYGAFDEPRTVESLRKLSETRIVELEGTSRPRALATRSERISALTSHGGSLYDGGMYGLLETSTGRRVAPAAVAVCGLADRLYYAAGPALYDSTTRDPIFRYRPGLGPRAVAAFQDRLLVAFPGGGVDDLFARVGLFDCSRALPQVSGPYGGPVPVGARRMVEVDLRAAREFDETRR
jgi:hypothetical protein